MPSLNKTFLLGTLARAPAFRYTQRGMPICTFDLQVDTADREEACVVRVVVWGTQAESSAQHLGAGSTVFVAGYLWQREYWRVPAGLVCGCIWWALKGEGFTGVKAND